MGPIQTGSHEVRWYAATLTSGRVTRAVVHRVTLEAAPSPTSLIKEPSHD